MIRCWHDRFLVYGFLLVIMLSMLATPVESSTSTGATTSASSAAADTADPLRTYPKAIKDSVNFGLSRVRNLTGVAGLTLHRVVRQATTPTVIDTIVKQQVYRNVKMYDVRGRVVLKPMLTHKDKAVRVVIDSSVDMVLQLTINDPVTASVAINADGTVESASSLSLSSSPPHSHPHVMTVHLTVSTDKDQFSGVTHYRVMDVNPRKPTAADEHDIPTRQERYRAHPLLAPYLPPVIPDSGSGSGSGTLSSSLTIMCVNLWNYNHWPPRIPLIAAELRRMMPDVIGFQEVRARKMSPHKEHRFQVEDLADMLPGYQYVYVPAMGFKEGDDEYVHEGIAILSRYPITETDHLKLTRDPNDGSDFHQRICLRAKVDTPLGLINVMSTHLSLSEQARNRTLPEIGRFAAKLAEPSVLVGDFNCVFEDQNILTAHGFHDAWLSLHSNKSQQDGWTFNSWDPKSRIDYTFVRGLRATSMTVEGRDGIPQTGLQPLAGVTDMKDMLYPSDHRFLSVTVVRDDPLTSTASSASTSKSTTATSNPTAPRSTSTPSHAQSQSQSHAHDEL